MFTTILILLAIVAVVGLFIPDKHLSKRRPRRPRRRHSAPHGLPWMDPKTLKKRY